MVDQDRSPASKYAESMADFIGLREAHESGISSAQYVAETAHTWILGGVFDYRFLPPEFDAWLVEVARLLRDPREVSRVRQLHLTPKQIALYENHDPF